MPSAIDAACSSIVDAPVDRSACRTQIVGKADLVGRLDQWRLFAMSQGKPVLQDPAWLLVLQQGLQHTPMAIEARNDDRLVGLLPLALVDSHIFGRRLVSLPRLGVHRLSAASPQGAAALIESA